MDKLPKILIPKKPTYIKMSQDVDFFELFCKIEAQFKTSFIFESLGEEGNFSRYSIIGFDPDQIISARENILMINDKKFKVNNPYFALRQIMPEPTISRNYSGGMVGYLGYDCINYFEPTLKVKLHPDFEQFMFGVYLDGLVFDKLTNELFYFFYTKDRSVLVKKILQSKPKNPKFKAKYLQNSATADEHAKAVEQVKELIKMGNCFQCEVGFKTKFKVSGNPLGIYQNLRQVNPSPFMYYLKFDQKQIVGASPELLFGLREGEMSTKPLAGTIKRGNSLEEDQQLARELLNDPKEIAEHNMLVDLHRNDIGRVAQFGTVRVRDLMSVKRFSHVQHISSEITGFIKSGEDMFSALSANFPAGTLTGAPKIESIKIINSLEREARGPYGGAIGQFGFNGDCTFAISIRSLYLSGTDAFSQTSGGIVYDSKPAKEYEEIERKLAAMRRVLGA